MKRIILVFTIFLMLVMSACSTNKVVENEMNCKFLDLYNKIEEAHRIMEYDINSELFTDEMYYNYGCAKNIDFDLDGNIWVYRTPGDGCYTLDLYSIDGNKYSYSYKETTGGGEDSEWYEKYVNNEEMFDTEYGSLEKEASKIFDKYDSLIFNKKRLIKLVLNNMKTISDYSDNINVNDYDSIELGKYDEQNILSTANKPIRWCILFKDGEKALLVSKKILMREKMNDSLAEEEYKNTSLHKYLNKDFYNNSFSESEKKIIIDNGYGKLFLISENDINKYVDSNYEKLITYATPIWDDMINDGEFFILPKTKYSFYWLRNDDKSNVSKYLDGEGRIQLAKNIETKGVRPAMWVKYK